MPTINGLVTKEYQDNFETSIAGQTQKYDLLKLTYSKI